MKDDYWSLTEKLSEMEISLITNKCMLLLDSLNQYQPLHILSQRKINYNMW